jgi:molybdopterin-guanine dinucleotide biosynthesis adapter protein
MMQGLGQPPIIGIVGWKKSGKTTLAIRLIEEFTRRGLRVATIKHAHHNFRIDEDETDSARHRRAGAGQVAIVSRHRWALVRELPDGPEPPLDAVIGWLDPCDLVIVEGYKFAAMRKIEVRRTLARCRETLADKDPNVVAIVADHEVLPSGPPVFALEDVTGLADFIAATVGCAARELPASAPT